MCEIICEDYAVKAFTSLTGIAAPLPMANISTDDIFPGPGAGGRKLRSAYDDPSQMGPNCFAVMRWHEDGAPKDEFILNQNPWASAKVLIARDNFGCGSSREHAVWCLDAIGMRCVIAPSFGDIFYGNCFKNGMLPVVLEEVRVEQLLRLAADPATATMTVDLTENVVVDARGEHHPFSVDAYRRGLLLEGLDEINASLRELPKFEAYETAYLARRPWLKAEA